MDKSMGFTFLLGGRFRSCFAYSVRGRLIRPAQPSIKNDWAAQPLPIPDIHRGIRIGVRLIPATAGVGVFFSRVDSAAAVTRFAGVRGRDLLYSDTGDLRFIADELLQLIERPVVTVLPCIRFRALALLRRANAFQIFQTDATGVSHRHGDDPFRDAMVDVRDDAALPAFKLQHGSMLAELLELLSSRRIDPTDVPDIRQTPEYDRSAGQCRDGRHVLPSVHSEPAIFVGRVGNFHRHGQQGIPQALAGSPEFDRASFGFTFQQRFEPIPVRGNMHLHRNALLDAAQQSKPQAERVAHFVQGPVLVVGFERQGFKRLDLRSGIGVAYGLVDPGRADLDVGERFGGQGSARFLRHSQDRVGDRSVQFLKPVELRRLGLVQPKEREFQRLGCSSHNRIISFLHGAARSKKLSRKRDAPYIPMAEERGFTARGVKSIVLTGKKIGIHTGRAAVRATCSFNIQTAQGVVQGISHRHCKLVQRADGYGYSTVAKMESEQASHKARIAPQSALCLPGLKDGVSRAK